MTNRREFLKSAGAVAALASVGGVAVAATTPAAPRYRVALYYAGVPMWATNVIPALDWECGNELAVSFDIPAPHRGWTVFPAAFVNLEGTEEEIDAQAEKLLIVAGRRAGGVVVSAMAMTHASGEAVIVDRTFWSDAVGRRRVLLRTAVGVRFFLDPGREPVQAGAAASAAFGSNLRASIDSIATIKGPAGAAVSSHRHPYRRTGAIA